MVCISPARSFFGGNDSVRGVAADLGTAEGAEEMIHYGVTKSAQISLARGLAETTEATGVTVNSVLPGPTSSEGVMGFLEKMAEKNSMSKEQMKEEFFKTARPTSLLKRFTTPEEIAAMVVFVCSPLSSAVNGAPLRADGGVVRAMA